MPFVNRRQRGGNEKEKGVVRVISQEQFQTEQILLSFERIVMGNRNGYGPND